MTVGIGNLAHPRQNVLQTNLQGVDITATLTHHAVVNGESEIQIWQARNIFKDITNYEVEFFTDKKTAVAWLASAGYHMVIIEDSETI